MVGLVFVRDVTKAGVFTMRSLDKRGQRLKVRLTKEMTTVLPGCWVEETLERVDA